MKAAPIFLHSGFRAASTWFWNRFRTVPAACAYYEPFHEAKAAFTAPGIAADRADAWNSGHPADMAPYNLEYLPLLRPGGGVAGYQERFAYAAYYANGTDEAQRDYIQGLIDHAQARGKVPVFGFCRSFGRAPWLRRHFPDAVQIVTIRDPWDQWGSVMEQARAGNGYFDHRYYLLACLARHRSAFGRHFEDLVLPAPLGTGGPHQLGFPLAYCQAMPPPVRLRLFLRVYLLDMGLALPEADAVVDLDRMSADAGYRDRTEGALRRLSSLDALSFGDCRLPAHAPFADAAERAVFTQSLAALDRDDGIVEAPSARRLLRALLGCVVERLRPAAPPPPAEAGAFLPPLEGYLLLTALALAGENGDGAGRALSFLRESLGQTFSRNREILAALAQFDPGPSRAAGASLAAALREDGGLS